MEKFSLGPFLGENNVLPDYGLKVPDVGTYVRAAINCDITNAGTFRLRQGRISVHAMVGAHSGEKAAGRCLFVRDSSLYEITAFAPYAESLLTTLTSNSRMSYAEHNGVVYFSNGTDIGRLFPSGVEPIALATPATPVVSETSGTLEPGHYQVALSYKNAVGEEGGITESATIELVAQGGIYIALPGASVSATHVNVYVSPTNGENPQLVATVAIGTASYTLSSPATFSTAKRIATNNLLRPMPPGKLCVDNGRLVSYSGKAIYYSDPFNFGLHDPKKNYILLENNVELVVPAQGGRYIMDGKTRWFQGGNIANVESVTDMLPYGAVPGTSFEIQHKGGSTKVGWMSENGLVIADTQGGIVSVQDEKVIAATSTDGFSFVHEHGGISAVVTKFTGTQSSNPLSPDGYDISGTAYVVNLQTTATTRYGAGFDANSSFLHQGVRYLLNSAGLHAMGGKLDGSAEINAYIDYGRLNFGIDEKKRTSNVYVGGSIDSKVTLVVRADDNEYEYPSRSFDTALKQQRFDLGRGLRANWFGLTLKNNGAYFEVATMTALIGATTRRI